MHLDIFKFWNSNKLRELQRRVTEYWDLVGLFIISKLSHPFYWINIQIGGSWFTDSPHSLNFNFIFGRKHLSNTYCDIMRYSIMIFSKVSTIKRPEELFPSEVTPSLLFIRFHFACWVQSWNCITAVFMQLKVCDNNSNEWIELVIKKNDKGISLTKSWLRSM